MSGKYFLGIDTGGTHTDAVVFDPATKAVAATAKASTTHHDLAIGVSEVMASLNRSDFEGGLEAVARIHLSTTLATNAIAENLGVRVGLILMGYDQDQAEVRRLAAGLPRAATVFIPGSHDFYGQETEELDEEALRRAVAGLDNEVAAWAVSGFFSIKNPDHELRASRIIKSISQKPVTMGRDLTGRLDAIRRALTAALNASLVLIIGRLLDAVKKAASENGLGHARLMVVKGDGTLVSEEWARERPVETVVSGPAAGLVGARLLGRGFLSEEERNLWVLDIGGTTCDMALVKDGLPAVNPDGARVGGWHTMTMAVETRTRGLGGDSLVSIDNQGNISLGPRRVLPLCRLAARWSGSLDILRRQKDLGVASTVAGCFFVPGTPPEPGISGDEEAILGCLARQTPFSLEQYTQEAFEGNHHFIGIKSLNHPSVMVSAFTPTDAMSILGLYSGGSREAAGLGAFLLGRHLKLSPEEVARRVLDEFGRTMALEIMALAFEKDGAEFDSASTGKSGVFGAALGRRSRGHIEVGLRLPDTVLLLGAPVAVLSSFLGKYLDARILVPPAFEVASAAGAASSPVHLSRTVEVHALPNFAGYRLFLPDQVLDGESVDQLVKEAQRHMESHMRALAGLAGAGEVAISFDRKDRRAMLNDGSRLDLGASLVFTATDKANC